LRARSIEDGDKQAVGHIFVLAARAPHIVSSKPCGVLSSFLAIDHLNLDLLRDNIDKSAAGELPAAGRGVPEQSPHLSEQILAEHSSSITGF